MFACALAGVLTATLVAMVDYVGIDTIQRYIPFATLPLVLVALGVFFVAVVSLTCWGMPRVPRMLVRSETWNPLPVLPIGDMLASVHRAPVSLRNVQRYVRSALSVSNACSNALSLSWRKHECGIC